MDGTEHPYPTIEYRSLPLPLNCSSAIDISWNAKGLTSSVTWTKGNIGNEHIS